MVLDVIDPVARRVLHFLLIGAALFGLSRMPWSEAEERTITVSAAEIRDLRRSWLSQTGSLPTQAELEDLARAAGDDEILYREARARGLARTDTVVRQRLVRNMRFLVGDEEADDEGLYRDALALGMDRNDVVVRRRLIQQMRFALEEAAARTEPDEGALQRYLDEHREDLAPPARVRLSHVFLSRERRGAALGADARRVLAELRTSRVSPDAATGLGDPLPLARHLPPKSEAELAKLLGPRFARAAMAAPIGGWSDPIESSYGLHLVWVHETAAAAAPPLDAVRTRVRAAVLQERRREALRSELARLRERYELRVDGMPSWQ